MILFLKKIVHKFQYAFAGLWHGIIHDVSILIQCTIALFVIVICFFLSLENWEWICILFLIAIVIALEFLNSALETVVDMVCPQYDKLAKRAKDYASAAVLVMSLLAAIVGVIIIGGKLL